MSTSTEIDRVIKGFYCTCKFELCYRLPILCLKRSMAIKHACFMQVHYMQCHCIERGVSTDCLSDADVNRTLFGFTMSLSSCSF